MKHTYLITSVRLSQLGEVGDTVTLSEEEFNDTPYAGYLKRLERMPTKKTKKEEPVEEPSDSETE